MNCKHCSQQFKVTQEDIEFYERVSPIFDNKKYIVSSPTLCPDCRQQRRLAHRNQNNLYKRKCDFSGEEMISLYSKEKPQRIYKESIWWSDKWDPLEYGMEFNFNRTFFDQFKDLQSVVPRRGMHQDGTNENCEYTTFGMSNKNCYLTFASFYCEDIYYSYMCGMAKDSIDCFICIKSELCYDCTDCNNCYNCQYCSDCIGCSDSYFLEDCRNCNHCIQCKNIRNKEYHINNKPVTKEEFNEYKKKNIENNIKKEKEKYANWKLSLPCVYAHVVQSENSTGDYLEQAKNCKDCFDIILGAEDCKHCQYTGWKGKDMMDCTMAGKDGEVLYEMAATVGSNHSAFCNFCRFANNCYYCAQISNCDDCFGCIGLSRKKYCILNKQYSRQEYEKLVPKIIEHMKSNGEWGEFFPIETSPFGYNETMAQDYFPLTKEEALEKSFIWKDENDKESSPQVYSIPKSIKDVPDSVINEVLSCEECKRNYKIIPQELKFYKKMSIPVPDRCHECRQKNRLSKRNPNKLWNRKCAKCYASIQTTYAPDRPETIYCEKCYRKAVY